MLSHHDQDDVAIITLNRPDRRNALSLELCDMIRETVHAKVSRGSRAIVITGEGTSFCSGADLNGAYGEPFRTALYGMFKQLREAPMPIIAAINGPAIGAGTQLAIACDLRVANETAQFGVPTARNGLAVDPWTIRRLTELAGGGMARNLLLGAGQIDRAAATRCGLVDREGDLESAIAWATELATLAPMSLAYSKHVLNNPQLAVDDADLHERLIACFDSEDVAEGQLARNEKRPPTFHGK